jgi:hypothetical protein
MRDAALQSIIAAYQRSCGMEQYGGDPHHSELHTCVHCRDSNQAPSSSVHSCMAGKPMRGFSGAVTNDSHKPMTPGVLEGKDFEHKLRESGRQFRVLVERIKENSRATLEALGYQVLTVCNGEEAICEFDEHRDEIDLLFFEGELPKPSGPYARISSFAS